MRVLLLTRYGRLGASSRIRSLQYLPYLERHDFEVDVVPMLDDAYVQGMYSGRLELMSIVRGYLRRITQMVGSRRYDLVWVEKEFLPWIPYWISRSFLSHSVPYIADYDDAQFHRYDQHANALIRILLGRKIDAVMHHAALVIVGNEYLAERAIHAGAQRVEFLPTVVDLEHYSVAPATPDDAVRIGWIGSPYTSRYLEHMLPVLRNLAAHRKVRLLAVGAANSLGIRFPLEVLPWQEETEVAAIQGFDIGIMPLPDDPFERGKCGYKLIQYMACGKPVIASPVGVNSKIVDHGRNGLLAGSPAEWSDALDTLCGDADLRVRMGMSGRRKVEAEYSLQMAAPRLAGLLHEVARGKA